MASSFPKLSDFPPSVFQNLGNVTTLALCIMRR